MKTKRGDFPRHLAFALLLLSSAVAQAQVTPFFYEEIVNCQST